MCIQSTGLQVCNSILYCHLRAASWGWQPWQRWSASKELYKTTPSYGRPFSCLSPNIPDFTLIGGKAYVQITGYDILFHIRTFSGMLQEDSTHRAHVLSALLRGGIIMIHIFMQKHELVFALSKGISSEIKRSKREKNMLKWIINRNRQISGDMLYFCAKENLFVDWGLLSFWE